MSFLAKALNIVNNQRTCGAMKTNLLLFLLFISFIAYTQDDDFCICMLDQPAYNPALDQTLTAGNDFNEYLTPSTSENNPNEQLLFMMVSEEQVEDALDLEEDLLDTETFFPPEGAKIKKRKRHRIPRWNAHKKNKKYKGKCPFF